MRYLSYDEMDKLTPCRVCGSHRYWFDGQVWQCWNCVPLPSADMIRVDLSRHFGSSAFLRARPQQATNSPLLVVNRDDHALRHRALPILHFIPFRGGNL